MKPTWPFLLTKDDENIVPSGLQTNEPKLPDYGVSTEKIADMKSAITAYKTAIASPKDATITRKQITDKMAILFEEDALLVEQIDLLMNTIKYGNPMLFSEYKDNRKV